MALLELLVATLLFLGFIIGTSVALHIYDSWVTWNDFHRKTGYTFIRKKSELELLRDGDQE